MTELFSLWLPILVSALAVFFVCSIIYMALPWHRNDYPKLPDEARVMDALRPLAIPPGDYSVPRFSNWEELMSPEYMDTLNRGPVLILTVLPNGPAAMARNLSLSFVYNIVVAISAAYVAGSALPPGAPSLSVWEFVGITAFIGYALALWQMSIWFQRAWKTTLKTTLDGLIYAAVTAAIFAWLWPAA